MAGDRPSQLQIAAYVGGMLLFGSLNTITIKIQLTMQSVGISGDEELFKKPWFATYNMFVGMALALAIQNAVYFCSSWRAKGSLSMPLTDSSPGHAADGAGGPAYWKKASLISIPSAFDLLATGLCSVGMLYIPASVWQMLRGCEIVFAAILAITCLKRRMFGFNWLGLFLCVVGVTFVSLANIWGGNASPGAGGDTSTLVMGMAMVVLGQVVQAAQVIAEEWLLKDVDLPEVQIIGWEGIWGLLLMSLVVYPILMLLPGQDNGHLEDPIDAMVMLSNSPSLLAMVVVYIFSCATYNVTGIAVTGALSAVHRTMLEASRTSIIWAFGLFVHYQVSPQSAFGEVWTPYSWLQLVGFVFILVGQSVYGEMIKVPGLYYPPGAMDQSAWTSPGSLKLSSPLPREC